MKLSRPFILTCVLALSHIYDVRWKSGQPTATSKVFSISTKLRTVLTPFTEILTDVLSNLMFVYFFVIRKYPPSINQTTTTTTTTIIEHGPSSLLPIFFIFLLPITFHTTFSPLPLHISPKFFCDFIYLHKPMSNSPPGTPTKLPAYSLPSVAPIRPPSPLSGEPGNLANALIAPVGC